MWVPLESSYSVIRLLYTVRESGDNQVNIRVFGLCSLHDQSHYLRDLGLTADYPDPDSAGAHHLWSGETGVPPPACHDGPPPASHDGPNQGTLIPTLCPELGQVITRCQEPYAYVGEFEAGAAAG